MVLADDAALEYEGVTQISAIEKYPQFNASAVELLVEEVYIEEGSYVQEGQQILKLTEDSYQEALDYYEASIIRAKKNLTDVEMEYEKGVQTSEYTLELAQAEADQAEFERDQSQEELDTLIEEHEEVESELVEMIEEVEEGIDAGSYETSSSSSYSSNSSGNSGNSSEKTEKEEESEEEKSTESENEEKKTGRNRENCRRK